MRKYLAVVLALGIWSSAAAAQDTYLANSAPPSLVGGSDATGSGSGRSLFGMVNSDRFHISNESSFSVFSGPGGSLSQGLNVTRLTYRASSPLSMTVGLGSLFMSSGSYLGYSARPGLFLHDFSLNYNAGGNSVFSIHYEQAPGYRRNPFNVSGSGTNDFSPFAH